MTEKIPNAQENIKYMDSAQKSIRIKFRILIHDFHNKFFTRNSKINKTSQS